jgi:hypothetical protein
MLSFNQWKKTTKKIDESFDVTLGVSNPSVFSTFSSFYDILEAKKKMKKKMMGKEMGDEDMDMDDEEMDDEEVPSDDEDMDMDDEDMDDEEVPSDDEDMDDEKVPSDDEDMGDEEEMTPMMRMKKKMKKMKKKMQAEAAQLKGNQKKLDADGDGKIERSDFKKLNKKKDDDYEEEEDEVKTVKKESFAKSLSNMISDANPGKRNWDGISLEEDALLPMIDPNTGVALPDSPGPGEVGYSPVTRIGVL